MKTPEPFIPRPLQILGSIPLAILFYVCFLMPRPDDPPEYILYPDQPIPFIVERDSTWDQSVKKYSALLQKEVATYCKHPNMTTEEAWRYTDPLFTFNDDKKTVGIQLKIEKEFCYSPYYR